MLQFQVLESSAAHSTDRFDMWSTVVSDLRSNISAEVGVFRGEFAEHILRNCPDIRRYYMIDPWRHLTTWNKPANKSDREFDGVRQEAVDRTDFARSRRILLEGTTTEVSDAIPDASVDLAYVDGDHTLRGISIDLLRMWPKIKDGGILCGDDFTTTIWQHQDHFEPTFIFPVAVHFAEAMDCVIYALPYNQFAIVADRSSNSSFEFRDLTGRYPSTDVREVIQKRDSQYSQFEMLYGDFRLEEDCRNFEITGLKKESGRIRGEIVKTVQELSGAVSRALLPGENNHVKGAYCELLGLDDAQVVTAGLSDYVDFKWDFEVSPPDFGKFDCVISQAMLEHLIDPYRHVKDLVDALNTGGYLVSHTVLPGFQYHRYPVDCVRFFPDWFEEVSQRMNLEICDRYIGDLRIMYKFRKMDG